jgi:hypothetical protein
MRIAKFVLPFAVALVLPAGAGATTFCVAQPAGCNGVALSAGQLESGAMKSPLLANGVADEIVIGPGTFVDPDSFTLTPGTDPVEIRGSGPDATVLTSTSTVAAVLLEFSPTRPITLRNLAVQVPPTWLDGNTLTYAIRIRGVVEDVRVTSQNPKTTGIEAGGTSTLRRVEVTANQGTAVKTAYGDPDVTIEDARLSGHSSIDTGNYANSSATLHVERSILTATSGGGSVAAALFSAKASSAIRDSLLRVRSDGVSPAVGIFAGTGSVVADHVTIVRDAGPVNETIGIWAHAPGDTSAQINLTNSVVSRVAEIGRRVGSPDGWTGTAKVFLAFDILPTAFPAGTGKGSVANGAANVIAAEPGFVNAAGGDFKLLSTSPGIDSGDFDFTGSATALDGLPRVTDGNGDGTAVTDRGAYEAPAPPAPPAPDPASGTDGAAVTPDSGAPAAGPTTTEAPAIAAALTTPARTCRVPKLRGRTLPAAKRALRRAGCRLGRLTGTKARGNAVRVKSQRIRAGKSVPAGTRVRLVLALRRG